MMAKALMIVDMQHDFLPGGALPVKHGDQVIPVIQNIVDNYDYLIFTQDYHPKETIHFEKWPVHCVRGTQGVEIHPAILELMNPGRDLRIIKGTGSSDDGYSAFEGRPASIIKRKPLPDLMRELGIEEVDVVGLAYDYCVSATAKDAAKAGFKTRVLYNATRSVLPDEDQQVTDELREAGVEVV